MKEDLRVIKTKQNIQSTFLKLLKTYHYKDITIKLLIHECQINRSTFYRNYQDKDDLLHQIVNDLLEPFEYTIDTKFVILDIKDENELIPYFMPLIDYFNHYKGTLILLYNNELPINIFEEMHQIYSRAFMKTLSDTYYMDHSQKEIAAYFSNIMSSNILTTIKWWHLEHSQITKEEILKIMSVTIIQGVYPSLKMQF